MIRRLPMTDSRGMNSDKYGIPNIHIRTTPGPDMDKQTKQTNDSGFNSYSRKYHIPRLWYEPARGIYCSDSVSYSWFIQFLQGGIVHVLCRTSLLSISRILRKRGQKVYFGLRKRHEKLVGFASGHGLCLPGPFQHDPIAPVLLPRFPFVRQGRLVRSVLHTGLFEQQGGFRGCIVRKAFTENAVHFGLGRFLDRNAEIGLTVAKQVSRLVIVAQAQSDFGTEGLDGLHSDAPPAFGQTGDVLQFIEQSPTKVLR